MALSPDVKNNLIDCLKGRPEIHFAILYGSAAEGRPFRDLDIGILVDRASVPPSAELDYAFGLADELERVVPHSVDVRVINDAPLSFRYNVSRGVPPSSTTARHSPDSASGRGMSSSTFNRLPYST